MARLVAELAGSRYVSFIAQNATPSELAEVKAARDSANAELERLRGEWDDAMERSTNRTLQDGPARLGVITIRTNNGMRYGWVTHTSPPNVPTFCNVDEVFPRNNEIPQGSIDLMVTTQQEIEEAAARFDEAAPRGDVNEFLRAMDARDSASALITDALDAQKKRNALSDAIRRDALETCAR